MKCLTTLTPSDRIQKNINQNNPHIEMLEHFISMLWKRQSVILPRTQKRHEDLLWELTFSQKPCISMSNIKYMLTIQFNVDLTSTSQRPHTLQSFMQSRLVNSFLKEKKWVVCTHSQYLIPLTYVDLVNFFKLKKNLTVLLYPL